MTRSNLRRLGADRRGAITLEYSVFAMALVVAVSVGVAELKAELTHVFSSVSASMAQVIH